MTRTRVTRPFRCRPRHLVKGVSSNSYDTVVSVSSGNPIGRQTARSCSLTEYVTVVAKKLVSRAPPCGFGSACIFP
jgi:hypothetical protein